MRDAGAVQRDLRLETGGDEEEDEMDGLDRLQQENRRLAVSLGAFSAFLASKGLLEEAWQFVHSMHQMDDSEAA